jgi:hypothetical protein
MGNHSGGSMSWIILSAICAFFVGEIVAIRHCKDSQRRYEKLLEHTIDRAVQGEREVERLTERIASLEIKLRLSSIRQTVIQRKPTLLQQAEIEELRQIWEQE